jgi:hypothetical protein
LDGRAGYRERVSRNCAVRPAGFVHLAQCFGREKSVLQRLGSGERSPGEGLGKTPAIALFDRFETAHTRP